MFLTTITVSNGVGFIVPSNNSRLFLWWQENGIEWPENSSEEDATTYSGRLPLTIFMVILR